MYNQHLSFFTWLYYKYLVPTYVGSFTSLFRKALMNTIRLIAISQSMARLSKKLAGRTIAVLLTKLSCQRYIAVQSTKILIINLL